MISPAVLERPGHWRTVGIIAGVLLASSPTLPLLRLALDGPHVFYVGSGFGGAVARSTLVASSASLCALLLGFPGGLVAGLYRFPARRQLLALLAVPLLIPSFLWSIGLSMLRVALGLPRESIFSGAPGVIMSFAALGTPLVLFATLLATRGLPARAIDAARLAGGEAAVLRYAGRAALPAAIVATMLAGLIGVTDPGPGQILGFPGAGTQILVSFSALYDFELAARQSLAVAGVVLLAALPLLWIVGRHLTVALLPHSFQTMEVRSVPAARWVGPLLLGLLLIIILAVPVAGLVQPVLARFRLDSVVEVIARTAGNTMIYGVLAGFVASALAVALVLCGARVARLRAALLAALMLLFVLPPAMGSLGTVLIASQAPGWLDALLRSRLTVAIVLGLRLSPIAAIILLRAMGSVPPSWGFAATVHGVGLLTYLRKLIAPFLARPAAVSIVLVALIATADTTTVLLLQPPGRDSFPLALFTVMANAPESLVASLCLAYLVVAVLIASALATFLGPRRAADAAPTHPIDSNGMPR
jgi:iron(III) transport system permease protein